MAQLRHEEWGDLGEGKRSKLGRGRDLGREIAEFFLGSGRSVLPGVENGRRPREPVTETVARRRKDRFGWMQGR